jgi:hypothetical protein
LNFNFQPFVLQNHLILFFFIHLFTCAYIGSFLPLAPCPHPLPLPPLASWKNLFCPYL